LTLAPGTYYLVLSSGSGAPAWEICSTVAKDTGVTFGGSQFALGGFNSPFPPASTFVNNARVFGMLVTGTQTVSVPALGSEALAVLTLLLLALGWRALSISKDKAAAL
jgi:hypothetical protein